MALNCVSPIDKKIRELEDLDETLILFLTARSEEYSELAGFAAGADDYITKPIKPKLLISRLKAILKRKRSTIEDQQIQIGNINIDKEKHVLRYNNEELHLARKEFHLLYYLMSIPGKVFTREDIIDNIWNDSVVGDRTIDVHIRKLRQKLGDDLISTIKGIGYQLNE